MGKQTKWLGGCCGRVQQRHGLILDKQWLNELNSDNVELDETVTSTHSNYVNTGRMLQMVLMQMEIYFCNVRFITRGSLTSNSYFLIMWTLFLLLPAILYSLMGQSSSLIGGIITGSQCWSHERDDQKAVQSVWGKNARRGAETQGWERNASGMHSQSVRAVLNLEVVSQSFHTLELTHVPSLLCLWLVMP